MPTGYTADLAQGEQPFEQFVWRCARAMGALVMMREEPTDAPIPERFEPSDYNLKRLREAKAEKLRLDAMTEEEAEAAAREAHAAAVASHEARWVAMKAQRERYEAMADKVRAWRPPSSEHEEFKSFMLDQLGRSVEFDCYPPMPAPSMMPGAVWREQQLKKQRDAIDYHAKEHAEEVARTDSRNRWLAALRESVPYPPRRAKKMAKVRLLDVMGELHNSEINSGLQWFFDGGCEVWLGDSLNGIKIAGQFDPMEIAEASAWLIEQARIYFPASEFTRRHAPPECQSTCT